MCVNNLSKVALDSAAAGIEPAISSRRSNALTTTPPSHTNIVWALPSYLIDDCCIVTKGCPRILRSIETQTLLFCQAWTDFGNRAFSNTSGQLIIRLRHVPVVHEHAIVTPVIKKHAMDSLSISSYRPISNLPFVSKLLERIVAGQLTTRTYLNTNHLLPTHQSAYRRYHSTETALLAIGNDALFAADRGMVTLVF